MKISTRTRYGTRLMIELGLRYGEGPVFLKDIARKEEISEKYLSQIIIPLKSAGLVTSFRGAHGGYTLLRSPQDITMKEVIEILESGIELVSCVEKPAECNRVSICISRGLWKELADTISEKLSGITLEDLVKRCRDRQEKAVMYTI